MAARIQVLSVTSRLGYPGCVQKGKTRVPASDPEQFRETGTFPEALFVEFSRRQGCMVHPDGRDHQHLGCRIGTILEGHDERGKPYHPSGDRIRALMETAFEVVGPQHHHHPVQRPMAGKDDRQEGPPVADRAGRVVQTAVASAEPLFRDMPAGTESVCQHAGPSTGLVKPEPRVGIHPIGVGIAITEEPSHASLSNTKSCQGFPSSRMWNQPLWTPRSLDVISHTSFWVTRHCSCPGNR